MTNSFVRKIAGYGSLTERDVSILEAASRHPRRVAAHRDLIREGENPSALFVVLEGWACRYKILPDGSRQIVAFMMPGDCCDIHIGELDQMDHSIGTITECMVVTVPRGEVEDLIVSSPALTRAFWRAQLIDEGVLRAWIVSIGRRSAIRRVAHLMLELYVRMRIIGLADNGAYEMPLTQVVLGDALGLTPVHTNRVVKKLRDDGVLNIKAKKASIPDVAKLTIVAGFDENYLHRVYRNSPISNRRSSLNVTGFRMCGSQAEIELETRLLADLASYRCLRQQPFRPSVI